MRLQASSVYDYYSPAACELRVYLLAAGGAPEPPGPYAEVLRRLGERHEAAHYRTFPHVLNLSAVPGSERPQRSRQALAENREVLYHPVLTAELELAGEPCEVWGEPDFMLPGAGGHTLREVKLARRVNPKDHPEICAQLQIYGWLYERTCGRAPERLEVLTGSGDIVAVAYDPAAATAELERLVKLRALPSEPYSPVGWTKCGGCGFYDHCWARARAAQDVAMVYGVDQGLTRALREHGVASIRAFLEEFDAARLAGFKKYSGDKLVKVGKPAADILRLARAMRDGREEWFGAPVLPQAPAYVMFDLEGLPPQLNDLQKIYLWGAQVHGRTAEPYASAVAGFGPDGDREGWERFLALAGDVVGRHGDIPWVHWGNYEQANLNLYLERYGDPKGIGRRVLGALLDLLPITRRSVALPLPSYGLKTVEKHIGFTRRLAEAKGDWSMAKYIEATETEDPRERDARMAEVLMYNEEDVQATWAVFQWLRSDPGRGGAPR